MQILLIKLLLCTYILADLYNYTIQYILIVEQAPAREATTSHVGIEDISCID